MQNLGLIVPQRVLQPAMSRQFSCKVIAADDLRDLLKGIVHHDGEVIGPEPVCALDDKIVLPIRAAQAPGMGPVIGRELRLATGSRVMGMSFQLPSGASTDKTLLTLRQGMERLGVGGLSRALKEHLAVPVQAMIAQLLQNETCRTGLLARGVEVFHAHKPSMPS